MPARLLLIDRTVNLLDEGIDAAVRIGHLPDSSLIAVKTGEVRRVVCASPEHLRRHKLPRQPLDLASHDCIIFSAMTPTDTWTLIDEALPMIEAQSHRRFRKSHLPLDALPIYDEVRYIHVARDGRDACMSFLNHFNSFVPDAWEQLDAVGRGDQTIGRRYPRPPKDPREFFRFWMADGEMPMMSDSFFDLERSFWAERERSNLLLVHYNDLKADLSSEMKRIADFLNIRVTDDLWPQLVEAASFESMKRDGGRLLAGLERAFTNGHETFLHSGTNNRWSGVLNDADLDLYEQKVNAQLSPALARWLRGGRLRAGDPKSS